MENYRKYIPVTCWKCGKMNNSAVTKICTGCGIYLKTPATDEGVSNLNGDSFFDNPVVKSSLIAGGIFVSCIVIFVILANYKGDSSPASASAGNSNSVVSNQKPETKKLISSNVDLPYNSWYNESLWSYVRKYPSASQVFEKNREVSGDVSSTEELQTIHLSGTIKSALTSCFLQNGDCYNFGGYPVNSFGIDTAEIAPVEVTKYGTLDDYQDKPYKKIAELELFVNKNDKSLRYAKILDPHNQMKVLKEVKEATNGNKGWKQIIEYNEYGNQASNNVTQLKPAEISKLNEDVKDIWIKKYYETDSEVTGLAKVGFNTAFVVESKNKPDQALYFDTVKGFLIRIDRDGLTMFLDDYRDYQGAKIPYAMYFRKEEEIK